jgi:hypothetical protein
VAPQFTIGNSSRNPVRGPAYRNLDMALMKHTKVSEDLDVEFRAEVFNFTNTPPLGAPNVVKGNAALVRSLRQGTRGDPVWVEVEFLGTYEQ